VGPVLTVVGALAGGIATVAAFNGAIGGVVFAFNALKLAMLTNPIGLILTGLVTAGILIYKYWEPIKELFGSIGEKWKSLKATLGFGSGDADLSVTSTPLQAPAPMPKFQASGPGVTNHSQNNTFNVTQLPGENSQAFVERLARELERRNAVSRRSQTVDGAGVQ
jgi:hypothetical protein